MIKRFDTILLEEAFEFVQKQNLKSRSKILQNIKRAEQNPDNKFFKKLNNNIWEFRTLYSGIQYRLLAFWDKENKSNTLVFATHGIIKKTSKVDKKEIEKAENIRHSYFKTKKK
ncbi:type II toxin-antitoxin system RelE/ParE family toxin [Aequorivita capsosiphonis]|uniref:type II toxin-antitoxin system RelE/ParE family toxin n=1 Tax=Aequorivita capsosiphonis TaxID=487317 RepID=UPI00040B00FA|nr:type II toxin-antitoxin system RelE/ParE family toxin [Aequorivita capsosiphonis]